ncbi:MAG: hypothetical protein D6726_08985 [Nitrospirae bacterium]|nr:MAG: hypothetical protein D6726_08985 [Nitrospirota bacterium]
MKRLLIIVVMSIVMLSCSGKTEIKNAVIAYNRQLIEALSTAKAGRLEHFASPQEIARVDAYILYLKKDGKLLISDIKELKFINIEKKKDYVLVYTEEKWSYEYIDFKTRKPLTDEELIRYKNIYTLKLYEGHWVVDSVKIKEEK